MRVRLAYGEAGLEIELPDAGVSVVEPTYVPGLPREEEALDEALNFRGLPAFPAVAVTGKGVFDTLRAISELVLRRLSRSVQRPLTPAPQGR